MKERILQIGRGKVAGSRAEIVFSVNHLESTLYPGDIWQTELVVKSQNHVAIRGMVHSINPLVTVSPTQMNNFVQRIHIKVTVPENYQDDVIDGSIDFVTDGGEYAIPYSFFVDQVQSVGAAMEFNSLEQLTASAKLDFEGTARVFASNVFVNMPFLKNDFTLQTVYHSAMAGNNWRRSLEEFLIYMGQKDRVKASVESTLLFFRRGEENKITMYKNDWGYFDLQVTVRKDSFVKVSMPKQNYQEGRYEIGLELDEAHLHGGKNQTVVELTINHTTKKYVKVILMSEEKGRNIQRREEQENTFKLNRSIFPVVIYSDSCKCPWNDYLGYDRKKFRWQTNPVFASYQNAFEIWELIEKKEFKTASEQLQAVLSEVLVQKEEPAPLLYSVLLMEQSMLTYGNQKTQCFQNIKKMAEKTRDARILYLYYKAMGTFIEMEEAERWFETGCRSPYLYHLLYLKWDETESGCHFINKKLCYQVMYFALRYESVDSHLLREFFYELKNERSYKPLIFEILCKIFDKNKDEKVLEKIVSLLIRSNKVAGRHFKWFELAVQNQLRLVGLYEAFLSTVPKDYNKPFPYLMMGYYSYNSDLMGTLKEKIYENLICCYKDNKQLMSSYEGQIKEYVISRLLKKEMSPRLAAVYRQVLQPEIMDDKLAEGVLNLCYGWKISVTRADICRVSVRYSHLEQEWNYIVKDGSTCICLYDDDAVLTFLDRYGNYYMDIPWTKEKISISDEIYQTCLKYMPMHISQRIAAFHRIVEKSIEGEEELHWAEMLLTDKQFKKESHWMIQERMVEYCSNHGAEHRYDGMLLKIDESTLTSDSRMLLVHSLVLRGFFEEAYVLLKRIGLKKADAEDLLQIVDHLIERYQQQPENFLIYMAYYLFQQNKGNHRIVEYLSEHMESENQTLYSIFQQARNLRIPCISLLYRMMVQSLFSGDYQWVRIIYSDYIQNEQTEEMLTQAANVVFCYDYLLSGHPMPIEVVDWMKREREKREFSMPLIRLVWMAYAANEPNISEEMRTQAVSYMKEYCKKGMFMAHFAKLVEGMSFIPENLEGRQIIEVHASEKKNVYLEYFFQEENERFHVPMREIYPGIYTVALTVFSDETLHCQALVESATGIELSEITKTIVSDKIAGNPLSTYSRLEQTIVQTFSITEGEANQLMDELTKKKILTEKLFPYKK
ncbi:MAG: DUF5717 family protein [Lachnospiraceae bacterium]